MREWKTFLFCIITTFQVVFIALSNALLGNKNLTLNITQLAGIPFVAFMSVLPVLIYVHKENVSRTELTVRKILHFLLTGGAVFGSLIYFGWIDMENAVITVLFFIGLYIFATFIAESRAKKLADEMNKKISAFHDAQNATHRDKG